MDSQVKAFFTTRLVTLATIGGLTYLGTPDDKDLRDPRYKKVPLLTTASEIKSLESKKARAKFDGTTSIIPHSANLSDQLPSRIPCRKRFRGIYMYNNDLHAAERVGKIVDSLDDSLARDVSRSLSLHYVGDIEKANVRVGVLTIPQDSPLAWGVYTSPSKTIIIAVGYENEPCAFSALLSRDQLFGSRLTKKITRTAWHEFGHHYFDQLLALNGRENWSVDSGAPEALFRHSIDENVARYFEERFDRKNPHLDQEFCEGELETELGINSSKSDVYTTVQCTLWTHGIDQGIIRLGEQYFKRADANYTIQVSN